MIKVCLAGVLCIMSDLDIFQQSLCFTSCRMFFQAMLLNTLNYHLFFSFFITLHSYSLRFSNHSMSLHSFLSVLLLLSVSRHSYYWSYLFFWFTYTTFRMLMNMFCFYNWALSILWKSIFKTNPTKYELWLSFCKCKTIIRMLGWLSFKIKTSKSA